MKYLLLITIVAQFCYCKSIPQSTNNEIGKVFILPHKVMRTAFTYVLPEVVQLKLAEYCNEAGFTEKVNYLVVSKLSERRFEVVFYSVTKTNAKDRFNDSMKFTNRFTIINGHKLPIILGLDYDFGDVNYVFTHSTHIIVFDKLLVKNSMEYKIVSAE
jgi:hypothetical protein